jgi:hypothetical protein
MCVSGLDLEADSNVMYGSGSKRTKTINAIHVSYHKKPENKYNAKFCIKKLILKCIFFLIFGHLNLHRYPGSVFAKSLDPDLDSVTIDPQHCK